MSALEAMQSIDSILANAKEKYEVEIKGLKDQLLAAQMELVLHKDLHSKAVDARSSAERFAQNLLTRFDMVEDIFFKLKQAALEAARSGEEIPGQATEALRNTDLSAGQVTK